MANRGMNMRNGKWLGIFTGVLAGIAPLAWSQQAGEATIDAGVSQSADLNKLVRV